MNDKHWCYACGRTFLVWRRLLIPMACPDCRAALMKRLR